MTPKGKREVESYDRPAFEMNFSESSLGNNLGELIDETLEIFEIHGGEDNQKKGTYSEMFAASRGGFEASCLRQNEDASSYMPYDVGDAHGCNSPGELKAVLTK